MDGSQMEMICFSCINVLTLGPTAQSITSLLFGLAAVSYYGLISFIIYRLSSDVWQQVKAGTDNSLEDIIQQHKYRLVGILYEDYRLPRRRIDLLMPLIYMVRSALISISVFLLLSHPWAQVILAILIESAYLSLTVVTRVRLTRLQNIIDAVICSLNVLFLILKAVTLFDIADRTRQVHLGIPMALCLVTNALINITFLLISTIMKLIASAILMFNHSRRYSKETLKSDLNLTALGTVHSRPAQAPKSPSTPLMQMHIRNQDQTNKSEQPVDGTSVQDNPQNDGKQRERIPRNRPYPYFQLKRPLQLQKIATGQKADNMNQYDKNDEPSTSHRVKDGIFTETGSPTRSMRNKFVRVLPLHNTK
jgi:hypothetical protein